MLQANSQTTKKSELIIKQIGKFMHRFGSRFWFGFTLMDATIFGILTLISLVNGEFLFALGTFLTGSLFCAGGVILYRYCKIMLNLIHQNDINKW